MKKRIFSLLLVVVLTMTACVARPDVQTETSAPTIVTDSDPWLGVGSSYIRESELKVRYLRNDELKEMSSEEVSDFFSEMVYISETEDLSVQDMYQIGYNFSYIWNHNYYDNYPTFDQSDFETQSYEAFKNIYEQAITNQIPLDDISSWASLPVTEVLCKYFSSNNFSMPERADCSVLYNLTDEDVILVAESFFNNPLMATNACFPSSVILRDCNNSVTDRAWEHLVTLSKSTSFRISDANGYLTNCTCRALLSTGENIQNMDKIAEIAENILENPLYSIYWKYIYFCYAFYDDRSQTYSDETIANLAFDSLFELAQNADEKTGEEIKALFHILDDDVCDKLQNILEGNS